MQCLYPTPCLFVLLCLLMLQDMEGQVELEWAKSMGSSGYDIGNSITTDAMGNVYTTGWFEGTVDFAIDVVDQS